MNLTLVHQPSVAASASPYRLLDEQGREVAWANAFLDAQRVRQLSLRSLRAYAFDLPHFARWLQQAAQPLPEITESTLLDYPGGEARATENLAAVDDSGDHARGAVLYEQASESFRRIGYEGAVAMTLNNLAYAIRSRGLERSNHNPSPVPPRHRR